jgi:acyl-CoA synthetase (AMP-forming)/AMP-acid ligase II
MSTPPNAIASIRDRLANAPADPERVLAGAAGSVRFAALLTGTSLRGGPARLANRSVLVATRDQFAAALTLIELDGIARRLIVCTPDIAREHLAALAAVAGADAVVSDHDCLGDVLDGPLQVACTGTVSAGSDAPRARRGTEWILLTSGTTGAPRMVAHDVTTLTAPIRGSQGVGRTIVWGTFYDIRRYGGLQILLRAALGGGSLVLSGAGEPIGDFLVRLGAQGVTHLSGTPSHWRRALMSPDARAIAPRYIRLSGEIADQGILNALRAFYPDALVSHAFASTEAGVGFEVEDGLEGFPASLVGAPGDVEIAVEDGSLLLRSGRNAHRYVGDDRARLAREDGFVDTGDIVERRGDRYYFLGRRSGLINVGGLKVYPEEIEAAINRHPAVRMSVVRSRKSPITGSLVAADVVLKGSPAEIDDAADVKREILQLCHGSLAPHKIPATIRFVPALEIAGAGKLARDA